MKNLLRKMDGWTSEMRIITKHKTKKALLDIKSLALKAPIASIVFIVALVFTMAYSSYLIFATNEVPSDVNINMFNRWVSTAGSYTPQAGGFVEYGSFPRDEITSGSVFDHLQELAEGGLLEDGKTVEYEGEKYLREDKGDTKHYFIFKPIKWQILDIDSVNNNLLLLSESILESRTWDTAYNSSVMWDGGPTKSGGTAVAAKAGGVAYPGLRLYLNSYDTTLDSYTYKSSYNNSDTAGSTLTYTPNQFDKFYDKGFLGKAFTEEEIEHIVPGDNQKKQAKILLKISQKSPQKTPKKCYKI